MLARFVSDDSEDGGHLNTGTGARAVPGSQRPALQWKPRDLFRARCAIDDAASRGQLALRLWGDPLGAEEFWRISNRNRVRAGSAANVRPGTEDTIRA